MHVCVVTVSINLTIHTCVVLETLRPCFPSDGQAHLIPQLARYGFEAEEIARYFGDGKEKNKQDKGSEGGEGGKEGRGDASDKEAKENIDAADEGHGGPEVEVEEGQEGADGNAR